MPLDPNINGTMIDDLIRGRRPMTTGDLAGRTSFGIRTVIAGDSMSSQFHDVQQLTVSYNGTTGDLTITDTGKSLPVGLTVDVWNFGYTSLFKKRTLTVTSRVDANNYIVNLSDKPSDLPSGSLAGTTFVRYPNRRSNYGWIYWLKALGVPLEIVANGGQDGDTSAGVLSRLGTDVLAYDPQLVIMQAPMINDQSAASGVLSEGTTYANMVQIVEQILGSGAWLILGNTTAVLTGEARATKPIMARVQRLNRRLYDYVRFKPNVAFLDLHGVSIDPANTTGLALSAYHKTDNIHWSGYGAYAAARYAKNLVGAWFPGDYDRRARSALTAFAASAVTGTTASIARVSGVLQVPTATTHGLRVGDIVGVFGCNITDANGFWIVVAVPSTTQVNLQTGGTDFAAGAVSTTTTLSQCKQFFPNPLLNNAATGGTVSAPWSTTTTPVMPQYINTTVQSGTVVQDNTQVQASVVASPSGYGNAAQLVVNCCSAAALFGFQFANITSLLTGFTWPGRKYRASCRLDITSSSWPDTPIAEIYANFVVQMDSTYTFSVLNSNYETGTTSVDRDTTIFLETDDIVIPAGTVTQAYWTVCIRAATAWNGGVTPPASNAKAVTMKMSQIGYEQVSP